MNKFEAAYWIIALIITEFFGVALVTYWFILYILPLSLAEFLWLGLIVGVILLGVGFMVFTIEKEGLNNGKLQETD